MKPRGLVVRWLAFCALLPCVVMAQVRGVSDKEIVLGSYSDLSGIGASWGSASANAMRLRFDEVNAKGGIHGRRIRLVVEDHGYQVPRAVQAAAKLIQRDQVFAIIGAVGTPMINAAMPQQLQAGVPNLFPFSFARSILEPPQRLVFQTYPTYYAQIQAGVRYFARSRGRKAICLMYQDTDYGREIADAVRDTLKGLGGAPQAVTAHAPTETDFNAAIAKLKGAGCDLVVLGTVIRDTILPYAAARRMGWDVDFLGALTSFDLNVSEAPNGATEGLYAMSAFDPAYPDAPLVATRDWAAHYIARFKSRPNIASQMSYIGADLLVQALEKAGRDLTVDKLIAAMESIQAYRDPFGGPLLGFGQGKHTGTRQLILQQVRGGRWVRVADQL
ncbi:Amino acid ABC transporter substrate-binding protein [Cupriavidus necator]|uniref:ABC transporter substrate-binding protein n=1 Tax=Cupriavidus necator TaxID=106590 RepID=UPI003F73D474